MSSFPPDSRWLPTRWRVALWPLSSASSERSRPVMLATHEPDGDRVRTGHGARRCRTTPGARQWQVVRDRGSITIDESARSEERRLTMSLLDTIKRANRPGPPEHSIQLRVAAGACGDHLCRRVLLAARAVCNRDGPRMRSPDRRNGLLLPDTQLADGHREDVPRDCSRSGRSHGSSSPRQATPSRGTSDL